MIHLNLRMPYILMLLLMVCPNVMAQDIPNTKISNQRAEGELFAAASGYYARARLFVIKATQEFALGVKNVDPSVLIDAQMWQNILLDRAEDLERILAIQPEANREGVSFEPAPRFINDDYLKAKGTIEKFGTPIKEATGKKLKVAIKHYAQARNLLLTAINEFDAGMRLANPQVLVNVSEWRNIVMDRAEDLNRVLSPKARESETGITYRPDSRLMSNKFRH